MKITIVKINKLGKALLGCVMLVPAALMAASTVEMNLDDLVSASDRIVVGKCVNVTSEWLRGKIYSQNTIQVSDSLKGDAISSYVVTTLGGKAYHPTLKTEIVMDVSGGLIFNPSEDVILFTKQNILGQNQVVGMSQGKFNIVTNKSTGEQTIPLAEKKIHSEKIIKDILGSDILAPSTNIEKTVITEEDIKLDQFVKKIKAKIDRLKK